MEEIQDKNLAKIVALAPQLIELLKDIPSEYRCRLYRALETLMTEKRKE